jgi:hypothetical protein
MRPARSEAPTVFAQDAIFVRCSASSITRTLSAGRYSGSLVVMQTDDVGFSLPAGTVTPSSASATERYWQTSTATTHLSGSVFDRTGDN